MPRPTVAITQLRDELVDLRQQRTDLIEALKDSNSLLQCLEKEVLARNMKVSIRTQIEDNMSTLIKSIR